MSESMAMAGAGGLLIIACGFAALVVIAALVTAGRNGSDE